MKQKLRSLLSRAHTEYVSRFLSYDSKALHEALTNIGIMSGDTVMVHSAYKRSNGFLGDYRDLIQMLMKIVTKSGLLVMPSMTYSDSSLAFLSRGEIMNVSRSPSHMGLISEIFRRNKDVIRSTNPLHPLLAWGSDAESFLHNHENCKYSFGTGSPFEKLLSRNAKILCFDVGFEYITFTHFVEDQIKEQLNFSLYEETPLQGKVIDRKGNLLVVECFVLSDESRKRRNEDMLISELRKKK